MENYIHRVHYYETDKMGVTHHSNYVRWMEEARVDFFDKMGYPYIKLEDEGIVSPVIGINCNYMTSTKYDDYVEIEVKIKSYNSVKLVVKYIMKNAKTGDIALIGESKHCFINKEGKPIIMKKSFPELDKLLKDLVEE